jgi:hypothetical protein
MWSSEGNGRTGSRAVRLHGVLQSWKKRSVGGVFSGCFVYGRGWVGLEEVYGRRAQRLLVEG